ncbi:MAG: tRNA pseudouridine synthase A [Acidobacteriota bacterium]
MPTFKVTLAYDGTDFVGWQRQASGTSIQGLLERALRDLDGHDVTVHGAGRTDAGVHAFGQVASFALNRSIGAAELLRAVNARFPESVRIVSAEEVSASFHARFGATRKVYRYRIWNAGLLSPFERAYSWHVPAPLDTGAMHEAAIVLQGRHDFAAFQASGSATRSSVREVFLSTVLVNGRLVSRGGHTSPSGSDVFHPPHPADQSHPPDQPDPHDRSDAIFPTASSFFVVGSAGVDVEPVAGGEGRDDAALSRCRHGGALVEYEVTGDGFLRHMVRNMVGSLVEVGRGRRPVEWISTVLVGRDRTLAGPTAPPHGLVLVSVEYGVRSLAADR